MTNNELTLFSWGYKGWGNATDKLVEAVDAVEKSRGRQPPVFVDVRARRGGRAEGFKENTFRDFVGPDRYRWMKGLGNRTVLERGGPQGRLVDAGEAVELLDLAIAMAAQKRRVIYFCSCGIPQGGCHRHWIAPELFKVAKKRGVGVTTIEWPGTESKPKRMPLVEADGKTILGIISDKLKNVPLPAGLPSVQLLGLPWLGVVEVRGEGELARLFSGPAEFRSGHWQLPILGGAFGVEPEGKEVQRVLKRNMLLPRTRS